MPCLKPPGSVEHASPLTISNPCYSPAARNPDKDNGDSDNESDILPNPYSGKYSTPGCGMSAEEAVLKIETNSWIVFVEDFVI